MPAVLSQMRIQSLVLLRLVDDLLDFSKLEEKKITLVQEPFLLREMVDQVLASVGAKDGVEMQRDIQDNVPKLCLIVFLLCSPKVLLS